MSSNNKVLIIAPHPDDEVLGCGGIIKKMTTEHKEVWILIVSRGKKDIYAEERIHNVRTEALEAHKILGVKGTRFLEYPAPELDLISVSELAFAISEVINELEPAIIFLPHRGAQRCKVFGALLR